MQRVTVNLEDVEHERLIQAASNNRRSLSAEIRHRLFPPAASQAAVDGDLPASQRADGEVPAGRPVRPISRRETAR